MKYFYSDYIGKSEKYAKQYGLQRKPGSRGHNDEIDAFRHSFMQALLCIKIGETAARRMGNAYELYGDITEGQPSNERNMDQWNNAVGREIAREVKIIIQDKKYTPQEIEDIVAEKVIQKMRKGDLITNPKTDNRKFDEKRFKDRILNLKNRIFHKNEISMNDLKNNPEIMDIYLDQALEKEGLPTKEELNSRVSSGNLVYVENYERLDGTKVSGYYRSYPNS